MILKLNKDANYRIERTVLVVPVVRNCRHCTVCRCDGGLSKIEKEALVSGIFGCSLGHNNSWFHSHSFFPSAFSFSLYFFFLSFVCPVDGGWSASRNQTEHASQIPCWLPGFPSLTFLFFCLCCLLSLSFLPRSPHICLSV